ncbi:MAG: hypothetical protein ACLT98_01920 [Eggerthellaceae bacterium]
MAVGMEGALPSVIGGWRRARDAVPTSVGYGASFGEDGLARDAELCAAGCPW